MVLERIFKATWVEQKHWHAYIMGMVVSIIGIGLALFVFPDSPGLISLAFISLLSLPVLYKLINIEERMEAKEKSFSFKELWKDNKNFVLSYLFMLFGAEIIFTTFAIMLPGSTLSHIFAEQVSMFGQLGLARDTLVGGMYFTKALFFDIFSNNLKVFGLCFLLSLLAGNSAILFLMWNISVWGTIFGDLARMAAINAGGNSWFYYLLIFVSVLPHGVLEVLAYIMAAISGAVISRGFELEIGMTSRMKEILIYNTMLFLVGIVILLMGGVVETFILENNTVYRDIIIKAISR